MCMYIYICTYIHTYIYIYIYMHITHKLISDKGSHPTGTAGSKPSVCFACLPC